MTIGSGKQTGIKAMIIYMILSLLFLASMKLHIHTGDAAMLADHGAAVSISDFSSFDDHAGALAGEVEVNPDGLFKLMSKLVAFALILLAAFGLLVVRRLCSGCCCTCILPRQSLPFFGSPVLRAPPRMTHS